MESQISGLCDMHNRTSILKKKIGKYNKTFYLKKRHILIEYLGMRRF